MKTYSAVASACTCDSSRRRRRIRSRTNNGNEKREFKRSESEYKDVGRLTYPYGHSSQYFLLFSHLLRAANEHSFTRSVFHQRAEKISLQRTSRSRSRPSARIRTAGTCRSLCTSFHRLHESNSTAWDSCSKSWGRRTRDECVGLFTLAFGWRSALVAALVLQANGECDERCARSPGGRGSEYYTYLFVGRQVSVLALLAVSLLVNAVPCTTADV